MKNPTKILEKICEHCKKNLPIESFNKRSITNDGFNKNCRDCYKELRRDKKHPIVSRITQKTCLKCNINKAISEFKTTKRSKDGYYHTCIQCLPPIQWNKEKQKLSEKKYIENNKEKIREKWKRDSQKINRKIRNRLNHRIWDALLLSGQQKKDKTYSLVGCELTFLKKWFEFQFVKSMNWDNIKLWHIDHVKPCKSYDLSNVEEQYKCFHWTNLRPCWAQENMEKSDTVDIDLIEQHKIKVEQFIQSTTNLS